MFIIIAGGGSLGTELVKKLSDVKKDIVLIDNEKEICDEIYSNYVVETIHGNATNVSVLKAAGIEKATLVIATMRNDADNLAFSVLAKSFAVPEIIVRMNKKSYLEAYKTAGATKILNVVDSLVLDILYQIEKSKIKRVAQLGNGSVEIFIVKIPENGKIVGKTISEIATSKRLPEESIILGIYDEKENEFKVARGTTKIPGVSDLFVLTKPDLVKKTAKYLIRS
ncbi:MAG: TrkA family potassium uptake protein [Spirochaetes bacterium]|nr:TrkA family potassium uptake protein [Spirochaetota bacterium]